MTVQEFIDHLTHHAKINFFDADTRTYICTLPSESKLMPMLSDKLIDTFEAVSIMQNDDEPQKMSYSLFINL